MLGHTGRALHSFSLGDFSTTFVETLLDSVANMQRDNLALSSDSELKSALARVRLPPKSGRVRRWILRHVTIGAMLWGSLAAFMIAFPLRIFAYEPFNIPSGSMIPTLLVGDYLFAAKYSYGYSRYSIPFAPALFSGRFLGALPERGDVAVFKYPRDTSVDYIKRIVGLPGDKIQMKRGRLYINGELCPRQPEGDYVADDSGIKLISKRYRETLPNGISYDILKFRDDDSMNNTPVYDVPADHVFALGDNRDNSLDSRFMDAVGFVPAENLVGRADILFFSFDAEYPWWEFWKWPSGIRWNRLFSIIH